MAKIFCDKCRESNEEALIKRHNGKCPSCGSRLFKEEAAAGSQTAKFFTNDPFVQQAAMRFDAPETIHELTVLDEYIEPEDCSECASERAAGHDSCIYCDKRFVRQFQPLR